MSNNQIALATEGKSLAEMMGLAENSSGKRSMLPRFSQIHSPVKGEIEVNGKTIKVDAIPAGAYKLTQSDDKIVYATNPKVRIFAQRLIEFIDPRSFVLTVITIHIEDFNDYHLGLDL